MDKQLDIRLRGKLERLRSLLRRSGGVLVAFSGGTDSSLLALIAHQELGDRALAVTAVSPLRTARETAEAASLAEEIGIRYLIIETREMEDETFLANPPDRCYHCKKGLFDDLLRMAAEEGLPWVVEGSNTDDLSDHRPGRRAVEEEGIHSPLLKAGMSKNDVRRISRHLGLPNWDKPSASCLASRFPVGTRLTPEGLKRVETAESLLKEILGIRQVRVRDYGELARIEVEKNDLEQVVARADDIDSALRRMGYRHVTLDLAGFRSGSMNP